MLICVASLAGASSAPAAERPPNVVLMLSDNLGFGEIGVYGGGALRGAPTPRLDALAAEGLRFTNFNVEVECTPSRSALLTGRMPVRSGTWRAASAGMQGGLAPWEVTLAETLSDAGYATAIFGKWHLGDSAGRYPTDQGFDRWWGFPFSTNVAIYTGQVGFDPAVAKIPHLLEGERGQEVRQVEPYTLENRPLIDERIAEKSIAYIRERAGEERPFFLFVSWSLVHHPYLPHPDFAGRSGNGAFSDVMVEHDHRVGQILDALEESGIAGDTLVIYASDNGPDSAHYPVVSNSGPYRGYLGSAYEGSIRTPMMVRWPRKVPPGRTTNEIVAMVDLYPTIARLAGAEVPGDRVIDGMDQTALLLGEAELSPREHVLVFSGRTLLAVKWRRFKMFLAPSLGAARLQRRAGSAGGGRDHHRQPLAAAARRAQDLRVPVQRRRGGPDPPRRRQAGEGDRRDPVPEPGRNRPEHVGDQVELHQAAREGPSAVLSGVQRAWCRLNPEVDARCRSCATTRSAARSAQPDCCRSRRRAHGPRARAAALGSRSAKDSSISYRSRGGAARWPRLRWSGRR
jgi:arylsulfatase